MTVFIEYAVLDNLIINALLLWFVFRTIKQTPPKLKIFLSALLGTGAALVMPLLSYTGVIAFLIKLFIGAAMVLPLQNRNFARFAVFYLLFLTYTFAFGGAVYGILFMFNSTSESLLYFTYSTSVPIGALILVAVAAAKLISICIKFLNLRHSVNNYLRDVVIQNRGDKFRIVSYLDTGNRLVDPETRAPVVIISLSLFLKMFPEVSVDRIFLNKLTQAGIEGGRYINFSTVEKSDAKMFTFAPQKFEVAQDKNRFKSCDNVRLGVSMRGFKDAVKYDALLNASLA